MKKDEMVQAVLFGVTTGGAAVGFVLLIAGGFDSADVFAFAGAIIGAAATVAGAAWLADRSANRERRQEQSLIKRELLALASLLNQAMISYPNEGEWTDEWRNDLNKLIDRSRVCQRFLQEVIAEARTLDFHQRGNVKLVQSYVQSLLRFSDDVFSENELSHWDERTWDGEMRDLTETTNAALLLFKEL